MVKVRARLTAVREDRAVGLYVSPDDWKYVHAVYKDYLDRKIECDVVIQKHVKSRTLPMNKLFHSLCGKIAKETKHTQDIIKEYVKETYGVMEKITVPKTENGGIVMVDKLVLKSTADYTIPEMCDIIMGGFELAANFGVDVTGERKDYDSADKGGA